MTRQSPTANGRTPGAPSDPDLAGTSLRSAAPWLVAGAFALNGIRLRRRARALQPLEPEPGPTDPTDAVHAPEGSQRGSDDGVVFLTASGIAVDDRTRRAAEALLRTGPLDVVDLVPADLPTGRALDLLREVDPATFTDEPLAVGRGAYQALAVRRGTLRRAGLGCESRADLSPAHMVEATVRLKRYAPTSMGVRLAPLLHSTPDTPTERAATLAAVSGAIAPLVSAITASRFVALGGSVLASPVGGLAALTAFAAQPAIALGGSGLRPRDLAVKTVGRPLTDPIDWAAATAALATPRGGEPEAPLVAGGPPDPESLRPAYQAEVELGVDRFLEPRRTDCPWCGASDLEVAVRSPELQQRKPGRFTLERCRSCGHIFQNPRLTLEGLDFYYRDFYDGLGEEQMEFVFGGSGPSYAGRADMVARHTTPTCWLDVGTGHGHFCLSARKLLPNTAFDGLDLSESIEEAERRGWVRHGYRGLFPEMVPQLTGRYDVVSMHHYLEHTRDPLEELDAAVEVVQPGGLLLIEVPAPESRLGRVLGNHWIPWFQPQHQHLVPQANLERALVERGMEIVESERGKAHQTVDLAFAAWMLVNDVAPETGQPWRPRPTVWDRVRRAIGLTLGAPLVAAAVIGDQVLGPIMKAVDGGNTYRVLARKPGGGSVPFTPS